MSRDITLALGSGGPTIIQMGAFPSTSQRGQTLTAYDEDALLAVAAQLNSRPRKTLGWDTSAERLDKILNASI
jgi:hypothetical protein